MENERKAKIIAALKRFADSFKTAMFPEGYVCLGCGKELPERCREQSLCTECEGNLPFKTGKCCAICGTPIYVGRLCRRCSAFTPEYDRAYAPFNYRGLIRKLILDLKIGGNLYLVGYLTGYMSDYMKGLSLDFDVVTAVPATKTTVRKRGFDHTSLLAEGVSEELGIPYSKLLNRKTHKVDQTKLGFSDRFKAVEGNFEVVPDTEIAGKTVLLIDDILTSGATASECAKVLKSAGAKRVTVLTIAR